MPKSQIIRWGRRDTAQVLPRYLHGREVGLSGPRKQRMLIALGRFCHFCQNPCIHSKVLIILYRCVQEY
jgi:hypothetical protein